MLPSESHPCPAAATAIKSGPGRPRRDLRASQDMGYPAVVERPSTCSSSMSGNESVDNEVLGQIGRVDRDTIRMWSQRSSQLREWASPQPGLGRRPVERRAAGGGGAESDASGQTGRTFVERVVRAVAPTRAVSRSAVTGLRRRAAAERIPLSTARLAYAAEQIDKSVFTRADLVEIISAQLPVDTVESPRAEVEAAVDAFWGPRPRKSLLVSFLAFGNTPANISNAK